MLLINFLLQANVKGTLAGLLGSAKDHCDPSIQFLGSANYTVEGRQTSLTYWNDINCNIHGPEPIIESVSFLFWNNKKFQLPFSRL